MPNFKSMTNTQPAKNNSLLIEYPSRQENGRKDKKTLTRRNGLIASLCACAIVAECLWLRHSFWLGSNAPSLLAEKALQSGILMAVALCFCFLLPKTLLAVLLVLQTLLTVFIAGSQILLGHSPLLSELLVIWNAPSALENMFQQTSLLARIWPVMVISAIKLLLVSQLRPYKAKYNLPRGTLLFMACCILLVPSFHKTRASFMQLTPHAHFQQVQSTISKHGYLFTWLAEFQSGIWKAPRAHDKTSKRQNSQITICNN